MGGDPDIDHQAHEPLSLAPLILGNTSLRDDFGKSFGLSYGVVLSKPKNFHVSENSVPPAVAPTSCTAC